LPYKGKTTKVFAYYATPGSLSGDLTKDKNLPAMVLVHGGGGQAFSKWVELWASRGYAAIAMDLAGNGPDKKRHPEGGPGQGHDMKFGEIEKPVTEQWTYHAVASVIRAHSLIRSFPEVDEERTALTGISWGGYTTCIVSGLDNRFKASVPVYGCGFLHENSCWKPTDLARMSEENRKKWVKLWGPSKYVASASMPMLFVNGGQDFAYPPDSHAKTYALVESEKNLRFTPSLPHGHIFDKPKEIELFIESKLGKGTALAKIGKVEETSSQLIAQVESPVKLKSAELHYTLDKLPGDNRKRKWISKPAKIENGRVVSPKAPDEATIWFLTVTDERDAQVSSELAFKN
ncbi:MAG: alpha/beta fold hydrolase, partial [Lentisphaeraceae bacterium]|nr:alpha/beta fold hydrolase [Lentisphaeraceae bacterium]